MMKYLPLFTAIEELLHTNNGVIIPALGAFSLDIISAELQRQEKEVQPPKATLNFNPNILHNDGILLEYLYETQGLSERTCKLLLEKWVASIHTELKENLYFQMPNLGTLILSEQGILSFNPVEKNFNINTAILPSINNLTPIARLQEQYISTDFEEETILQEDDMELDLNTSYNDANVISDWQEEEILTHSEDKVQIEAENIENQNSDIVVNEADIVATNESVLIAEENTEVLANTSTEPEIEQVKEQLVQVTAPTDIIANTVEEKKSSKRLIYILLTFFLLAILFWLFFKFFVVKEPVKIPETTDNIAATEANTNTISLADSSHIVSNELAAEEQENKTNIVVEEEVSKPIVSTAPNAKTYIVVIGAFAEQKYVDRSLRLLKKEGYFPNIVTTGKGLQRIGIEITCTKEELKLHLKDIRRKFHPEAWVVKD